MMSCADFMKHFYLPALLAAAIAGAGCKKEPAPGAGGRPPGGFAVQAVVIEARVQPVSESLSLVGTVAANEMVEIKSETDGTVEKILVTEGQQVNQGDLLVKLDDSKFAAAVAEAEANFKLSEANHERSKQLFRDKLISQQEFDQIAAQFQVNQAGLDLKRRQLRDTQIRAPFSGIVGARQISPGQVIGKNTTLTWLVDLDPVKVEVSVPERYISQVALGQAMEFGVAAFPNDRFKGEVYFISPQLDSATRTALVKARIPNPGHKLKGGMFANLALTLRLRDSAIVVPEPALVNNGDAVTVFVVDDKSLAQVRLVKIGLRLAGKAEVLSGVQAGDRVVVEGVQKLFPGALVKPAPAEAAAPYLN
jgi:membrane fusion protein (multidrug efflux system)